MCHGPTYHVHGWWLVVAHLTSRNIRHILHTCIRLATRASPHSSPRMCGSPDCSSIRPRTPCTADMQSCGGKLPMPASNRSWLQARLRIFSWYGPWRMGAWSPSVRGSGTKRKNEGVSNEQTLLHSQIRSPNPTPHICLVSGRALRSTFQHW